MIDLDDMRVDGEHRVWLERLKKVIAKADSTTFPEEADTAYQMADALRIKLGIDLDYLMVLLGGPSKSRRFEEWVKAKAKDVPRKSPEPQPAPKAPEPQPTTARPRYKPRAKRQDPKAAPRPKAKQVDPKDVQALVRAIIGADDGTTPVSALMGRLYLMLDDPALVDAARVRLAGMKRDSQTGQIRQRARRSDARCYDR